MAVVLSGLEFSEVQDGYPKPMWHVVDLNYGSVLGKLIFADGPGWVIVIGDVVFLDQNQLETITEFIKTQEN